MKNNKIIIALLIVALFIPTYIGIANYILIKNTPVTMANATEFEIKDNISGRIYVEKPESELAKLFNDMNTSPNTQKIDGNIDGNSGKNSFILTSVSGDKRTDYFYYFHKDKGTGYYIDDKGTTYKIDDTLVASFLESSYAQSLYDEAILPTLTNGNNVIVPANYDWKYITAGGNISAPSSLSEKTDAVASYTSKSGLSFEFSRKPDTFSISVKDANDAELYNGSYDSLIEINETKLKVDITAEWISTEALPFGTANYSFVLDIAARPEFYITFSGADGADNYKKFEPGDVALISVKGASSPEKIKFEISKALMHDGKEISPVFYTDGTDSYAFLPVAYDTAPGEYSIKLTYEGTSKTLDMTVASKTFGKASTYSIPASAGAYCTPEVLDEFDSFITSIIAENDFSTKYFTNEKFVEASTKYEQNLVGYGKPISAPSMEGGEFRNEGIIYTRMSGRSAQAVMDGKVIYVGYTKFSGNIIVIDHGYGLLSWYYCLDQSGISVKAGDIVKKGDVLCTKFSNEGFTGTNSLFTLLTVRDVPVYASDFMWGSGISFK